MADELVKTDVKYRSVAKAMLGRIVVVDTVDNAVKIARKYQYGIRMVTLEGELLIPGGAIAGGAFKNSSNLLGRRREIDELQKQTEELKAVCSDIEKEIAAIKDRRNEMRLAIENKKADLQNMLIEQNTARMNVEQAREKQNETQEGFGNLKSEQEDMDLQTADIQTQKTEIVNELTDSEELEKSINEKYNYKNKIRNSVDEIKQKISYKLRFYLCRYCK